MVLGKSGGGGGPFFKYIPVSAGSFPGGRTVEKGEKISGKPSEKPVEKPGKLRPSAADLRRNPDPRFSTAPCRWAGLWKTGSRGGKKGENTEEGGKGRRRAPGESAGGKTPVRRVIHSGKRRGRGGFPKADPPKNTEEERFCRGISTKVFHRLWKENAEFSVFHRLLKSLLENVKEQTGKTVWKSCFFLFAGLPGGFFRSPA